MPDNSPRAAWRRLPAGIRALGFVSMLMDVSSEMRDGFSPDGGRHHFRDRRSFDAA